jgi:opacity protein-like surface antigen
MFARLFIPLMMSLCLVGSVGAEGYVGIYGGIAIPETFDDVREGNFSISDLKLKTGPMVGFKFGGYAPASSAAGWLGVELDGAYTKSALKAQTIRLSGAGFNVPTQMDEATVHLITGAVHVLVRYPGSTFQPYLGAGPAVVHARSDGFTVANVVRLSSSEATALGLSGVAGFRLLFTDHIGLFAEYKHIRATLEFDDVRGDAVVHGGVGGLLLAF